MWIKREIERIWPVLTAENEVVVLTGSRQVGKSALLEHLYGSENLVALDLPRKAAEAQNSPELFLSGLKTPAIIDEIQYAPNLFRALKAQVDSKRVMGKIEQAQWLLTGSEKFSLMEGVSESLAGRAGVVELNTLSLRELESWSGKEASGDQLLQWLTAGGYPKLHAQELNRERFFSNLIATYLERDIRRLLNVQNLLDFDKFIRLCALRTGQLLSMSNIASDLGVSQTTIKKWLGTLQASGVIDLLEPWHLNPNKRLVKTPKLYFNDTGLCLYLMGISSPTELMRSPLLGHVFETLCYGQLKRSQANQGVREKIYFFRTHDGEEVDFVISRGSEHTLYECKFAEDPNFEERGRRAFANYSMGTIRDTVVLNSGRSSYRNAQFDVTFMSCADAGRET